MRKFYVIALLSGVLFTLVAFTNANGQTLNHTFRLSWVDNSNNEEGFFVYRVGTATRIGQVGANVLTFSDTVTGTAGQQFCYQVSAFNHQFVDGSGNLQESAKSAQGCGVIPIPSQTVPNPPSDVQISAVSSSEIQILWSDNSDNETAFKLSRRSISPPRTATFLLAANTTGYLDHGLQKNKRYCYRIAAANAAGISAYTTEACAATQR